MTEADAIALADHPVTVQSLADELRALGVRRGRVLMVHTSMSRLGYVAGGAQAVVLGLMEAVGAEGTIVMPTHSGDRGDPAKWENPPVPEAWWETLRSATPAFDSVLTPTRGMGAVAECFRRLPDARRSDHPTLSFTACGRRSEEVVGSHPLPFGLGEASPLGRLYDLDAEVLLLGVTHANNTSLHLAEHRADLPGKRWTTNGSSVRRDGRSEWVSYEDLEPDDDDFERLGDDFASTGQEQRGPVGAGTARLFRQRDVVDFAVSWLEEHRRPPG